MHMERKTFLHNFVAIKPRIEKDKYSNDVTIISVPGFYYRMVHNSAESLVVQRATIFAGRLKFLTFRSFKSNRDGDMHTAELGGYKICWDGDDNVGVVQDIHGPILPELRCIREGNEALFVATIIDNITRESSLWRCKQVKR